MTSGIQTDTAVYQSYLGVPNTRAIEEAQEVQECQPGHEQPVYLPKKLLLVDFVNVYVSIVEVRLDGWIGANVVAFQTLNMGLFRSL